MRVSTLVIIAIGLWVSSCHALETLFSSNFSAPQHQLQWNLNVPYVYGSTYQLQNDGACCQPNTWVVNAVRQSGGDPFGNFPGSFKRCPQGQLFGEMVGLPETPPARTEKHCAQMPGKASPTSPSPTTPERYITAPAMSGGNYLHVSSTRVFLNSHGNVSSPSFDSQGYGNAHYVFADNTVCVDGANHFAHMSSSVSTLGKLRTTLSFFWIAGGGGKSKIHGEVYYTTNMDPNEPAENATWILLPGLENLKENTANWAYFSSDFGGLLNNHASLRIGFMFNNRFCVVSQVANSCLHPNDYPSPVSFAVDDVRITADDYPETCQSTEPQINLPYEDPGSASGKLDLTWVAAPVVFGVLVIISVGIAIHQRNRKARLAQMREQRANLEGENRQELQVSVDDSSDDALAEARAKVAAKGKLDLASELDYSTESLESS